MKSKNILLVIIAAWLVAGTLDILGAILILSKGNATGTFKYIAGAVNGDITLWSNSHIILFGAAFHYFIALCWTVLYFIIYKAVKIDKLHIIIAAVLYGTFIFLNMRYIFVPLFGTLPPPKPITAAQVPSILENIAILSVAFGVTLKLFARKYFGK